MPDAADLADSTILYPDHLDDTFGATSLDSPPLTKTGKVDGRSRAARAAKAANGPARKSTPNKAPARGRKDYKAGVEGTLQLVAGGLFFVAPADAAAVGLHSPNIAQALDELAQSDPRVAAILDKILQVGPYGTILAAVAPLIVQILVNHGKMPAGFMGAGTPEQVVGAYVGQMTP